MLDYDEYKKIFEKDVFYIIAEAKYAEILDGLIYMRTQKELKQTYLEKVWRGERKYNFIDIWIKDETRKQYKSFTDKTEYNKYNINQNNNEFADKKNYKKYNISKDNKLNYDKIQSVLNDKNELDIYIRQKLGQTNFPACNHENCNRNKCNINNHIRFNFDAQDIEEYNRNKDIINLIKEDLNGYEVIISSHEGSIEAYIVTTEMYRDNNYEGHYRYSEIKDDKLPYVYHIDYSAWGTTDIITDVIKTCNKLI